MSRPANRLLALLAVPLQRLRNLILRPARHELGDARREMDALRAQVQVLLDTPPPEPTCSEIEHLQALEVQVRAAEGEREALRAELQVLAASLQVRERADEDEREALRAELRTLAAALEARRRHGRLLERLLVAGQDCAPPRPAAAAGGPPRASIILPTRDRGALVQQAIRSVQAQTFTDWELIVVDDGSSDDTREVVGRLLEDPRIRLESIAHAGASAARNHGLRLARGQFHAYLDSDNLWFPGFLSAAVAELEAEPGVGLVYGALATDAHGLTDSCLLFEEFNRPRLLQGNFIDLNTVVHRRELFAECGGFDESLGRLVDWDLLLRYTAGHAARALPVLAARYRACDAIRITDNVPMGPNWFSVRKRAEPLPASPRPPRILYVVWHYPQLSETYVEDEIRCMRRMGIEIEVWRTIGPASPFESSVRVHDGELADAVRRFKPDALHVHWMSFALAQAEALSATGLPVTLRMHGFDVRAQGFAELLAQPWAHKVYAFPSQLQLLAAEDARVVPTASAFDTSRFHPVLQKDRRLVLRASACLPSKDIGLFFELARRLPDHHFVFAGVTCNEFEHYPAELVRLRDELGSPVELRFDVPRAEMAELMGRAAIYLHTINPPDAAFGAPIGMPISIAEAMASGAYVIARDLPELADYVGDAGALYSSVDEAERLIAETAGWSDRRWQAALHRSSDRGYLRHADEVVLRPMYEEWCRLASVAEASMSRPGITEPAQTA